jgi:hypothetical protein
MDTSLALLLLLAPFIGFLFSLEKVSENHFWNNRNSYCCTFVCNSVYFFSK